MIFDRRSVSHTLGGLRGLGQNSTFSEHGHVAYQIKGNHEMQQPGNKYFACRPPMPLPQGDGVNRSKVTFSEHGQEVKMQLFSGITN